MWASNLVANFLPLMLVFTKSITFYPILMMITIVVVIIFTAVIVALVILAVTSSFPFIIPISATLLINLISINFHLHLAITTSIFFSLISDFLTVSLVPSINPLLVR